MFIEEKTQGETQAPAKLSDWQKVLLRAANLIESKGWIQGYWQSDYGYCMRGAVYAVVMDTDGQSAHDAWPVLQKMEEGMPGNQSCMGFNDTKGRTKDEVIARMRSIALGHGDR